MIKVIALAELKRRLQSPGFWLMLGVLFILLAVLFLSLLENFMNQTQLAKSTSSAPTVSDGVVRAYLWWAGILLPGVMPILASSAITAERQNNTWVLLSAAPVHTATLVLGKFTSVAILASTMIACVSLPIALLGTAAILDIGQLFSGLIGLWLLTLSAAAAAIYFAIRLNDPVAAILGSYALLLLLGLFYLLANFRAVSGSNVHLLASFTHFSPWLEGRFSSLHLSYFLLMISGFIGLAIHHASFDDLRGH